MSVTERAPFLRNRLIADFQNSDRFQAMIRTARSSSSGQTGQISVSRLSGKIFEEIGFLNFRRGISESDILLGPEETFAYFAEICPDNVPEFHTPFQHSLYGQYIPDAILGKWDHGGGSSVAELIEFTSVKAGKLSSYVAEKLRSFRFIKARYPELFRRTRLHIVTANNTAPDLGRAESAAHFLRFSKLPVSTHELGAFASWVAGTQFHSNGKGQPLNK